MKTMIFCTSYINNNNFHNNGYRITRWIDYYSGKLEDFGAQFLFIIDDGSPIVDFDDKIQISFFDNIPTSLKSTINFVRFKNNLGRPRWEDYQGWWRSFIFSLYIARKYEFEKIIHIESDFYVLSDRMVDYIKSIKKGWIAFYSEYHDFPETGIQIICSDRFLEFEKLSMRIKENGYRAKGFTPAEKYISFSKVEKEFIGDRIGQPEVFDFWTKSSRHRKDIDYIGQVHPSHSSTNYKAFFNFKYDF